MKMGDEWGNGRFEDAWIDGGYTQVPNLLLFDAELSAGAYRLYALLSWYVWRYHRVPSQEKLGAKLGLSDRTVRRYITELQERDYIIVRQLGLGDPAAYTIRTLATRTDLAGPGGHGCPTTADTDDRAYPIIQERHTSQEHTALLSQLTAEERQRLEEDARALPQMEGKSEEFLQKVLPGLMVGLAKRPA